jgi:hypoxanthine phosphoribosyltransferase
MDKLIITTKDFRNQVAKICRDISLDFWTPEYVVGIGRGGLTPAVMISHYFNVPMQSLDISLRDGGECVSNVGMAEDAFGPEIEREIDFFEDDPTDLIRESLAKNILIVDDINDTGATFNWIMEDWPKSINNDPEEWKEIWNNNVRFAVLIDNQASQCKVKMDYSGMEINKAERDVWIEFPWENWWSR